MPIELELDEDDRKKISGITLEYLTGKSGIEIESRETDPPEQRRKYT